MKKTKRLLSIATIICLAFAFAPFMLHSAQADGNYSVGAEYDAYTVVNGENVYDYVVEQSGKTEYNGLSITPFTAAGTFWDASVVGDKKIGEYTINAAGLTAGSVVVLEFKNAINTANFERITLAFGSNGGATFEVYNANEIAEGTLGAAKTTITVPHWAGVRVDLKLSDYADESGNVSAIAFKQTTSATCEIAFSGFILTEISTVHTVTFIADGVTVESVSFNEGDVSVTEPTVPVKEGYSGFWQSYVLGTEDITVNAVYTYNYAANTEYDAITEYFVNQTATSYAGLTVKPFAEFITFWDSAYFKETGIGEYTAHAKTTNGDVAILEFAKAINAADFTVLKLKACSNGGGEISFYNAYEISGGALGAEKLSGSLGNIFLRDYELNLSDFANDDGIVDKIAIKVSDSTDGNGNVLTITETVIDGFSLVSGKIATDIEKVVFNDTGDNKGLYIYPSENDYPTQTDGVATVDASAVISGLNTLGYIYVNGKPLSEHNLGGQYVNLWTRWGALGFILNDFSSEAADKGAVKYIEIKAGCEIPSYAAVKGGETTVYLVKNDLSFVYSSYRGEWVKDSAERLISVSAGEALPVLNNTKTEIFLGWEKDGELYKAGTAAASEGTYVAAFYDYYLVDGAYIRLGDTAAESGIRFEGIMNEAAMRGLGGYIAGAGVIVLPTDLIGSSAFTTETSGNPAVFYAEKSEFSFSGGKMNVRCTIKTIREANYNRSYSGRAFLKETFTMLP